MPRTVPLPSTKPATRAIALAFAGILVVLALVFVGGWLGSRGVSEQRVALLDPAQVVVVRTPGGMLEVSRLERVEEFAWKSQYLCRWFDCSALLGSTVSRARVHVSYVYRIALAQQWTLRRQGDHYELQVPGPQLQEPVAFDTTTLEITTQQGGIVSPPRLNNRERLVRELGPELAQRGRQAAYLQAQRAAAEQTVREFAQRWMLEQGQSARLPVRVIFTAGPAPA